MVHKSQAGALVKMPQWRVPGFIKNLLALLLLTLRIAVILEITAERRG